MVRYAGAAYLAFLGVGALRAALRRSDESSGAVGTAAAPHLRSQTAFRQGLISNLTNPKMVAFFAALLPQFVPDGGGAFPLLLLLGFAFAAMTLVWLSAYAVVVAKAGDLLRHTGVRRLLEAGTGAVLLALGLRLATEGHS
jgi:threonine/homoserine/homoserine lactone efflux protein